MNIKWTDEHDDNEEGDGMAFTRSTGEFEDLEDDYGEVRITVAGYMDNPDYAEIQIASPYNWVTVDVSFLTAVRSKTLSLLRQVRARQAVLDAASKQAA